VKGGFRIPASGPHFIYQKDVSGGHCRNRRFIHTTEGGGKRTWVFRGLRTRFLHVLSPVSVEFCSASVPHTHPLRKAPAFPNRDPLPILGPAASPADFQIRSPKESPTKVPSLVPSRSWVGFPSHSSLHPSCGFWGSEPHHGSRAHSGRRVLPARHPAPVPPAQIPTSK